MLSLLAFDRAFGVSILRRRVAAEIHAASKLAGPRDDRYQLIEIVALDDGVESNPGDSHLPHAGNRSHDLPAQTRNPTRLVVPLVEIIKRDVELVDSRLPQRARPFGREDSDVGD